jgi:hypothetical protein
MAYDQFRTEQSEARKQMVLKARRDGKSFPQIAHENGWTQGYVYKIYKTAMNQIIAEDVKEVRQMELERLDAATQKAMDILQSFHPLVSGGEIVRDTIEDENGNPIGAGGRVATKKLADPSVQLAAIDKLMKIMERRARLMGLDAPTKNAFTDPSGEHEANIQFYIPSNGRDQNETADGN